MKIFAFTINLFDKYKYAIKVILFLLKHLVYKDPADREDIPRSIPRINIPIPIIPNIKKLLIDQNLVQGVIDKMKRVIVDNADAGANTEEETLQRATSENSDIENTINNKIPELRRI
jgi:hypothetical protein